MTENKHTPGPWVIDRSLRTAVNAGPKHVAMVNFYNSISETERIDAEENEANAHLISAAPDLLSALKDAMRSTRKDFESGPDGDRQHTEAWAEQFAAIAKAEGKP